MNDKTINFILIGVIIYLIIQQNKNNKIITDKLKYAEAIGTAKAIGDLGTIF